MDSNLKEIIGKLKAISKEKLASIDKKQLEIGAKHEAEHTNDPKTSKLIAAAHILEDPNYYDKIKSAGLEEINVDINPVSSKDAINQPDTASIDKQTAPGTVYPEVDKDKSSCGCCSNSIVDNGHTEGQSNTDAPAKDPTSTDHVTGGMSSTPENPSILQKNSDNNLSKDLCKTSAVNMIRAFNPVIPDDAQIDFSVSESKKLLSKLKREGYGGNPSNDKGYVKDKRWTLKWK